jgi:hypothetical protein
MRAMPRVVDENVDPTEGSQRRVRSGLRPGHAAHVGHDGNAAPACGCDLCGRVRQTGLVPPDNRHVRAGLRQHDGSLGADAFRAAGHQRPLALHRKACRQRG